MLAIAFVAVVLLSDVGAGSGLLGPFQPLGDGTADAEDAADHAGRTWEGGGARLQFVDTMDPMVARHYESMDPFDDGEPFDYYGGAVPQVDAGEVLGLWEPARWRHEWWRWGEESLQKTEDAGDGQAIDPWYMDDAVGAFRFGVDGLPVYPPGTFSGLVSPVVDLRSVEPVHSGGSKGAEYRSPPFGSGGALGLLNGPWLQTQDALEDNLTRTGVVEASERRFVSADTPQLNASAALRLRHAYGFQAVGGDLSDGTRVEVSRLDPVHGWTDWEVLLPSPVSLRVGAEELEGRFAEPVYGGGGGFEVEQSPQPEGNATPPDISVYGEPVFPTSDDAPSFANGEYSEGTRPWLYQGPIEASSSDRRGMRWSGFGGQSGGLVESVFDLTPHAGHLLRFRFLAATELEEIPTPGLGWVLDQLEVHAEGASGVEIIAPVAPTEGALLDPTRDFHPIVAVHNTGTAAVETRLRVALGGYGAVTDYIDLGTGPVGRSLHEVSTSLHGLLGGNSTPRLHHLEVTAIPAELDVEALDVGPSTHTRTGRYHFQVGGPSEWRALRVETEAIPLAEDDDFTRPTDRAVQRGQKMRVHVDLENLGPEPIDLSFRQTDRAPLWPALLDAFGGEQGRMRLVADDGLVDEWTVTLPPSREASGSLGDPDALRRVTWEWTGTPKAATLDLFIDDPQGETSLDGGPVLVEARQPNALDVDFSNRWALDGCHRHPEKQGRIGVIECSASGLATSPVETVVPLDLRRGGTTHVFAIHRGNSGNVTLESHATDPTGPRPDPADPDWTFESNAILAANESWSVTEIPLHAFPGTWSGWIRVRIEVDPSSPQPLLLDELRVEAGSEGKRLPLLWHLFDVLLEPETSGEIRASNPDDPLAILDGAAARRSDVQENQEDQASVGIPTGTDPIVVDTKVPGISYLRLPQSFVLDGARPTLNFWHWMAPSVKATGKVEVARIEPAMPVGTPEVTGTWETVAVFHTSEDDTTVAELRQVSVPLWEYAGETVLVRFHYEYGGAQQPGISPTGWILDDILLEQIRPGQTEALHASRGTGFSGYEAQGVLFDNAVDGTPRSVPVLEGDRIRFERNPEDVGVCATQSRTNTYDVGQSAITDPVDLRALYDPVLVLEHGGEFQQALTQSGKPFHNSPGTRIMDVEWQVLGGSGEWGDWQRATPHDTWATIPVRDRNAPWSGAIQTELPHLRGPGDELVEEPFTSLAWPESDLVGEDATVFSLAKGPAGEIVRFRFHVWEEYKEWDVGPPCVPLFEWNLYSMKIFEDVHLFDAAVASITVTPNDRDALERLGGNPASNTAVLASDRATVDVRVRNDGRFPHQANVTLSVEGAPDASISFVKLSGGGLGIPQKGIPHGLIPLERGETGVARFLVEFNRLPPGTYMLRAVVDLEDALDTNPRNDVMTQAVEVLPVRALSVDRSTAAVDPFAATPEQNRTLSIRLRNEGNVDEDRVEVRAKVVELVGVTREADLQGPGVEANGYVLRPQEVGLSKRTGAKPLTWDLVKDAAVSPNADLASLLRPGTRYAVNITLHPAQDSATVWWDSSGDPIDSGTLVDLTDPGSRCGCFQIPFLVEDLLAATDLTPEGTAAILGGYLPGDGLTGWNTSTRVMSDGAWHPAKDRPDLPRWSIVDEENATRLAHGAKARGNAWSLPAYAGFEQIEHHLVSPPLPGHVVNSTSRAILKVHYASDLETDQARIETRVLEPGGAWGPWQPADALRSQRVAVVVSPDYPKVISDRLGDGFVDLHTPSHPVPPFYDEDLGTVGCKTCHWSPFPLFPEPSTPSSDQSLVALATTLQTLADHLGAENVGVFSTLGNEFGVPSETLGTSLGIEYEAHPVPTIRVPNSDPLTTAPHELPVLDLNSLGLRLDTYGAIIVVGDGLTRYVAGESAVLDKLSTLPPGADPDAHPGMTLPNQRPPAESGINDHFEDLLEILRTAPAAGVEVIAGLGPASAVIGKSGIAEGVPLTVWQRGRVVYDDGIVARWGHRGLTDQQPVDAHPKDATFVNVGSGGEPKWVLTSDNYRYMPATEAQAWVLREQLARGGALLSFEVLSIQSISDFCIHPGGSMFNLCASSTDYLSYSHPEMDVTFVSVAKETHAAKLTDLVLEALDADGGLPPGTGTWQDLDPRLASPVGGRFVRDATGQERFEGEAMQFRLTVSSSPASGGHGTFLLDGFEYLGTPRNVTDLAVRVADPQHGSVREPGESGFFVTVEAANRGLLPLNGTALEVGMRQTGDCGERCIVHELHPDSSASTPQTTTRTVHIPPLDPGDRHIVTVGGPAGQAAADAPPGITYSSQAQPFLDDQSGRFPPFPAQGDADPTVDESRFAVTAQTGQGTPPTDADAFLAANDVHQVIVRGQRLATPLVEDPVHDVRVLPNQSPLEDTDAVDILVHLTNRGSVKTQVGRVEARLDHALPRECFAPGPSTFFACDPEGTPLPNGGLWSHKTDALGVPRGKALDTSLRVPVADLDLAPGTYRLTVDVHTSQAGMQTAERWLYLGDGDTGWASYREDLQDVAGNQDAWDGSFPPGQTPDDDDILGTASTPCRTDNATRAGTEPGNGDPLLHGWRISDAHGDPCQAFRDAGNHALQWLRSAEATAESGQQWPWPRHGTDPQPSASQVGAGDFGPDAIIWYPGQEEDGIVEDRDITSGGGETLANFPPGQAALLLDTRFQATPHTAYVVEMQVPVRSCTHSASTGDTCRWAWNWGSQGSSHWFPLQASGVTTASPSNVSAILTPGNGLCIPPPDTGGVPASPTRSGTCTRNHNPTNPLWGLPGIWGGDSASLPGADDAGWVQVRYPIGPVGGLPQYCASLIAVGGDQSRDVDASNPFRRCMYASNGDKQEIPRPVAFRLSAASFGGDEGANRWQVRDLTLTAHDLALGGPQRFRFGLIDGESRIVPVQIRNDGAVDDIVEVHAAVDPGFEVSGVRVGVSRHPSEPPHESLSLPIPGGSVRTAWAHINVPFGAGGLQPGIDFDLPVTVTARSTFAPGVAVQAFLEASFRNLERADLAVDTLALDGSTQGMHNASQHVPVHATALLRNQGFRFIDGEPVLVRLVAQRIDPSDTSVLWQDTVAEKVVEGTLEPNCHFDRCAVPANLEWLPEEQGLYDLTVEINQPRAGDEVLQVPESSFSNNALTRRVTVGPVPLADLQVLDVRLVPFDGGCGKPDAAVPRLIDGHSYCVLARVANNGSLAAVEPIAEFSVGAADPFSTGAPPLGDLFPGGVFTPGKDVWVASSPRRAALPADGTGALEFRVEVDTRSATASVEAKERIHTVPIDDYELELLAGDAQEILITPGGEVTVAAVVRNTGTAVATPTATVNGTTGDMRVHLVQPPPLQPGEEARVNISVTAAHSVPDGTRNVEVLLSTLEDPHTGGTRGVAVPLVLRLAVADAPDPAATLLPLRTAPRTATLDAALDNTGWGLNGTWTATDATPPLRLEGGTMTVGARDTAVLPIRVVVPPHTAPGRHEGTVSFQVVHAAVEHTLQVPYELHVDEAPALAAQLEAADISTTRGSDATIRILLENTGNTRVETALESVAGDAPLLGDRFVLDVGENATASVVVEAQQAQRVLGETRVHWWSGGASNEPHLLPWSVHYETASVRIRSTDLDRIDLQPGRVHTVQVVLGNPAAQPLRAEALLLADGYVHSRGEVDLEPEGVGILQLRFQAPESGGQVLQVVARPAGSDVDLADPLFPSVGDLRAREAQVQEDNSRSIPGPGLGIVLLLGAVAAMHPRRRP